MAERTYPSGPCRVSVAQRAVSATTLALAHWILLALLWLCCVQSAQAASWQHPPEVVYVESESPFPLPVVEAALRYAVDAWSARVELPLQYAGLTDEAGYAEGRIVIRWLDTLEMVQTSSNILSLAATKRWVYTRSDAIAGVEIYLHRDSFRARGADACFTHAILHEIGYALGISHLTAPHAVMHASLGTCQHTLTTEDIAAAPYQQHICHAELLANQDIYLPVINFNGRSWSARLRSERGLWTVTEQREVLPQPACEAALLRAGDLLLDKVWTPDHIWQAELTAVGNGQWKLRSAR